MEILGRMAPAQRLAKAFELSEMTKRMFYHGLRERFPDLSPQELHQLFLKRLNRCHNRIY
jgi:hypothetical protein